MQPHLFLAIALAAPFVVQAQQSGTTRKPAPAGIAQLAWISGTWTAEGPGNRTVEERWTPAASGMMLGVGRTLRGSAMLEFEFVRIVERQGTLVYLAMPNARTPATEFTLTAITDDSATFENPAHDFPKLVRYSRLADGSLQATISGGAGTRETSVTLKKTLEK